MSMWTRALSTALVDFLWQGAIVGLLLWLALTLLRRRSASTRYVVSCLALAVMTLLPLATIAALWMRSSVPQPAAAGAATVATIVTMPQTMLPIWLVSDTPRIVWLEQLQLWALPLWSAGVLLFSLRFAWSYRHSFAMRRSEPCADAEVLRSLQELAGRIGITRPVRVLVASIANGPAVVGWLRPAVLLPPAAAMGITPQQLQAVLAHELAHIKRHDYLVNIFQVVAETLFFYHPAVWWTSKQIRIERELCCDDIAVRSCGDPISYARALTTLARQQLASPALTMGATGGSLLHRVQRLIGAEPREFGPGRVPGVIVVALAIGCVVLNLDWLQAFGQAQVPADTPRFEVASVKVNRRNDGIIITTNRGGTYNASGFSLSELIRSAYQVQEFQIVGGPSWIGTDRFDIVAKAPEGLAPEAPGTVPTRHQRMLRALLAERFSLAVHKETREMPVYALVLARPDRQLGPQLQRSTTDCSLAAQRALVAKSSGGISPWQRQPCGGSVGPGIILAGGKTMAEIATDFSKLTNTGSSLNRLVVDRTGLDGAYDMELRFTPERIPDFGPGGPPPGMPAVDPNGPSIFTAVQEQLGLKLDSQRGPVEVLVIDRAQEPEEN